MRELIKQDVINMLLHSRFYAEWVSGIEDNHRGVVRSLDLITDRMLLSLYARLVRGDEIVPCLADADGKYLNILLNSRTYGGMVEDGTVHT